MIFNALPRVTIMNYFKKEVYYIFSKKPDGNEY